MGVRVNGLSGFGFGVNWEYTESDKRVAERVLAYLEDRRLLFGLRIFEDQRYCIESALQVRQFLTEQIGIGVGRELGDVLRSMRAAFRKFVENGGPNGVLYHRHELDPFSLALGELRSTVGHQIAMLAVNYDLEVESDLAAMLPPQPSLMDELAEENE